MPSWPHIGRSNDTERKKAAQFVQRRGSQLHDGLGGSSQYDSKQGQFVDPVPYRDLEEAMRQYIPANLGIQVSGDAWDDLFEKLSGRETIYQEHNRNARKLFWWKLGERSQHIEPWLALIPDSYGLSVLKASVALVLKLAEDSVEKRDKIFDAFLSLRDTIVRAQSQRKSFRTVPAISDCANRLFSTLVGAIEDLILFAVPKNKKSSWRRWIPRFEHHPNPQDPDEILQRVSERATALELAVGHTRDTKIENTEVLSRNTNAQVSYIREDVVSTKVDTKDTLVRVKEQGQAIQRVETGVRDVRDVVMRGNDELMGLLMKQERKIKQMVAHDIALMQSQVQNRNVMVNMMQMLLQERDEQKVLIAQLQKQTSRHSPTAVVTVERLFAILAQTGPNVDISTMETIVQHPGEDLERALYQRHRFKQSAQAQAQSLLRHGRFVDWLGQRHPDLISVDANIQSAALERLSVVSVFCATFIASMVRVKPQEAIAHFFCGLHCSTNDPWYGPNGLVRSIILQLLMKLARADILNLDFINDREYLMDLEGHDLPSLCQTLHELLYQFPPDMTVYCIIDGVSCFDKNKMFGDLKTVIGWLDNIVGDKRLRCVFKVLMTNPKNSSMRVKNLLDKADIVRLVSSNLFPSEISNKLVESRLLRHTTSEVAKLADFDSGGEDGYEKEGKFDGYETS